jgi:hypothetical protein
MTRNENLYFEVADQKVSNKELVTESAIAKEADSGIGPDGGFNPF